LTGSHRADANAELSRSVQQAVVADPYDLASDGVPAAMAMTPPIVTGWATANFTGWPFYADFDERSCLVSKEMEGPSEEEWDGLLRHMV